MTHSGQKCVLEERDITEKEQERHTGQHGRQDPAVSAWSPERERVVLEY